MDKSIQIQLVVVKNRPRIVIRAHNGIKKGRKLAADFVRPEESLGDTAIRLLEQLEMSNTKEMGG